MIAVVQDRYGPPEVLRLGQVDRPEPGPGEVLVRVAASSVHADVWHAVAGRPWAARLSAGILRPKLNVPGTDVAGLVEQVGPGVEGLALGEAVFGASVRRNEWVHGGAFAEFVVAPAEYLAKKPERVGFAEAACVPTSGHIALQNLRDRARTVAGKRVLVNGAAGGVGSVALQVVKDRGAHVTGVDAGAKLSLLRDLGADEVIDYTEVDFTEHRGRYDLIFDVPGNHSFARCRRALKPDGRYVPIGFEDYGRGAGSVFGVIPRFLGLMVRARFTEQLKGPGSALPDRTATLTTLQRLLEQGALTPIVATARPIAEAAEALRQLMAGQTIGRIVLTPDPDLLS